MGAAETDALSKPITAEAREGAARQIELTPEIIEAGVDVLLEFEWGWSNPQQTVRRIWQAMTAQSAGADHRHV